MVRFLHKSGILWYVIEMYMDSFLRPVTSFPLCPCVQSKNSNSHNMNSGYTSALFFLSVAKVKQFFCFRKHFARKMHKITTIVYFWATNQPSWAAISALFTPCSLRVKLRSSPFITTLMLLPSSLKRKISLVTPFCEMDQLSSRLL